MKFNASVLAAVLLLWPALSPAKPVSVKVKGMVCAFCAQGIEKKFKRQPEVASVKVSLESKTVSLDTKEGQDLSDERIKEIVSESGYDVLKIERAK